MENFYLIELLEDVNSVSNNKFFRKGERLIAWEDDNLGVFWVANDGTNTAPIKYAKKIFKIKFEEINNCNC